MYQLGIGQVGVVIRVRPPLVIVLMAAGAAARSIGWNAMLLATHAEEFFTPADRRRTVRRRRASAPRRRRAGGRDLGRRDAWRSRCSHEAAHDRM
jgi:hypothetical protein